MEPGPFDFTASGLKQRRQHGGRQKPGKRYTGLVKEQASYTGIRMDKYFASAAGSIPPRCLEPPRGRADTDLRGEEGAGGVGGRTGESLYRRRGGRGIVRRGENKRLEEVGGKWRGGGAGGSGAGMRIKASSGAGGAGFSRAGH